MRIVCYISSEMTGEINFIGLPFYLLYVIIIYIFVKNALMRKYKNNTGEFIWEAYTENSALSE